MNNNKDTEKLHNEINQLRNQQFLITLAALSLFGIMSAWMVQHGLSSLDTPEKALPPNALVLVPLSLLFILGYLYFWLRQLTSVIIRLSTYLELRNLSDWEKHHRIFTHHDEGYVSQSKSMGYLFAILGIITIILFLIIVNESPFIMSTFPKIFLAIFTLAYIAIIFYCSKKCKQKEAEEVKTSWEDIF